MTARRGERPPRKREGRRAWQRGLELLTEEGGGVVEFRIFHPDNCYPLIVAAAAGDERATKYLNTIADAIALLRDAPVARPILCLTCDTAVRAPAALVLTTARRDNPTMAISCGLCSACNEHPERTERIVSALGGIWPGARAFTISHSDGGRA